MATENFPACLAFSLKFEGGKSNDPRDPGGKTNQGIIQRTYDTYRASNGRAPQDVYAMSNGERDEIYRRGYWRTVTGDSLPAGVDLCIFDYAVNSGPARALRTLATAGKGKAPAQAIDAICGARLSFLRRLRTWQYFGKGWSRRVAACEATALKMAGASLETARDKLRSQKRGTDASGAIVAGGGMAMILRNLDLSWGWLVLGGIIIAVVILWLVGKSRNAGMRSDVLAAAIAEVKARHAQLAQATETADAQLAANKAAVVERQHAIEAAESAIVDLGAKPLLEKH